MNPTNENNEKETPEATASVELTNADFDHLNAVHERNIRRRRLAEYATSFLVAIGGAAVLGLMIVPSRTAGATRTARLEWQRREAEMARALEPAGPDITATEAATTAPEEAQP